MIRTPDIQESAGVIRSRGHACTFGHADAVCPRSRTVTKARR
jgi:hypothetical protein